MSYVVDASVAVKWVVPEALSEHADRLLGSDEDLMAPELMLIEAANALWKKQHRRELSPSEALNALEIVLESGVVTFPMRPLMSRALAIAGRLGHPVYDCVYIALAERQRATLVTADERMLRRLGRRARVRVANLRNL